MRVELKVIDKGLDYVKLETFIGRVLVEYNRHGWYMTWSDQRHFIKKDYYFFVEDLIKDLDEYCNERFNEVKHLIVT